MVTGASTNGLYVSYGGPYGREQFEDDFGIFVAHCRIVDNPGVGLLADNSTLRVSDTVFAGNGLSGVYSFFSHLVCERCTLVDNALLSSGFSSAIARQGFLRLTDSSVSSSGRGLGAINFGILLVVDSSISSSSERALALFDKSGARLEGSTLVGPDGVSANGDSSIQLQSLSSVQGNLRFNFSRGFIEDGSSVTGNVTCVSGGDTVCENPASITGMSTCGQCPK